MVLLPIVLLPILFAAQLNWHWAAAGVFVVVLGLLGRIRYELSHTTLVAPVNWAILAWTAWGLYQWALVRYPPTDLASGGIPRWAPAVHWLVAGLSLCPIIAILGARQPQSRGWQWIVASLWAVLALPAITAGWIRGGGVLEVHALQGWFLWILVAMGVVNYLPTKFAPATVLVAMSQVFLLQHHLPLLQDALRPLPDIHPRTLMNVNMLSLLAAAWTTLALVANRIAWERPSTRTANYEERYPQNAWREFRNLFGLVWGLRVADALTQQRHC